jgi:hypothetical protein
MASSIGAKPTADRLSRIAVAACFLLSGGPFVWPASALEELSGEKAALEACDRRVCAMLLHKDPKGEDLRCTLTKTWARSTIKGADSSALKWGFGDARCTVRLEVKRAALVNAVTKDKFKFFAPAHTADCLVEQNGQIQTVKATLAPKIVFKDGKAEKIWVNLKEVEGPPAIRELLRTAAQLEDSLGLFHHRLIKSVNRYIYKHCAKLS